jgi:hydroxyacylglutathione hydrolase
MHLEDHLGDIIRKARTAARVSASKAAQALRLPPAELEALEQTGQAPAQADLRALALLVGLHPRKLEEFARGWRPPEIRLARWRELRQISTVQGGNLVNCFLAWDPRSRQAALFDTGWDAAPVRALLEKHRLVLEHLCVTHAHQDHIAALATLENLFPGLAVHRATGQAEAEFACGSLRLSLRPVPGHAHDGAAWIISGWPDQVPAVACVGDTLFAGSMAKGFISTTQLRASVRRELLSLPPETLLCPGHGPVTTVGEERAHNPFLLD